MSISSKVFSMLGYSKIPAAPEPEAIKKIEQPKMSSYFGMSGYVTPHIARPWGGEKTYGEMGAAIDNRPEYQTLALRSWDAYLNSDIAKSVVNNYILWSVGKGLTLQVHPDTIVLESEDIKLTKDQKKKFTQVTDARFRIHTNSRNSTYDRKDTLQTLSAEVKKNMILSGDCLIVNRYNEKTGLNAEMIDGMYVQTPSALEYHTAAKARGNRIIHGVEINERRTPIAFYVVSEKNKYTRIPARSRALNKTTAYLVYRDRYRVDYVRGLPLLSVVLETLKKLDRYKEATVGSAEEVAKIAYQVVHGTTSTGKAPITAQLSNAALNGMGSAPETSTAVDPASDVLATRVAVSTGKQVFNNTVDSHIEPLEHKNELYFKEFWETNFNIICGALGIPPEVALGRFNENFSGSRMAAKAWEYAMQVDRFHFAHAFYKPYFNVWLEVEILRNKIEAPGYLTAMTERNHMAIESYRNCRFIGASIPHVDPAKEATAERILLGDDVTPLTTFSQASERLNLGNWEENATRNKDERDYAEEIDLIDYSLLEINQNTIINNDDTNE